MGHKHHEDDYEVSYGTPEDKAERIKYLTRGSLTNAGLFALTAVSGVATGNTAVLIDSGHEAIDTGIHGGRLLAERRGANQNSRRSVRNRKLAFYLTGLFSGLMTGKMIVDAAQDGVVDDAPVVEQVVELGTAAAIAAGNIYAHRQIGKIHNHSPVSGDSHDHAETDRNASVGLAITMAASNIPVIGPAVGLAGGIGFGAYTTQHMIRHGRSVGRESDLRQDDL